MKLQCYAIGPDEVVPLPRARNEHEQVPHARAGWDSDYVINPQTHYHIHRMHDNKRRYMANLMQMHVRGRMMTTQRNYISTS
jgi:hypothetical protein